MNHNHRICYSKEKNRYSLDGEPISIGQPLMVLCDDSLTGLHMWVHTCLETDANQQLYFTNLKGFNIVGSIAKREDL